MEPTPDDVDHLLDRWDIPRPRDARRIHAGANNLSYVVSTAMDRYVLRFYQNVDDPRLLRYEHDLLIRIQGAGLSFAVPAPIPARTDGTLVEATTGRGVALAALFPFIPGSHPSGWDLAQSRACGAALAELDGVLSQIDGIDAQEQPPRIGDLYQCHPAVPDPFAMVSELPATEDRRDRLVGIFERLLARIPALYDALPQQVVHRDFDGSNALMEGNRVTGVLDFEFAAFDIRAIDLAYTLSTWKHLKTFARGYLRRLPLTGAEIDAVPDLMRLYRAVSLIHRAGRQRQGIATQEAVVKRVGALLEWDDWLSGNGEDLVRMLRSRAESRSDG